MASKIRIGDRMPAITVETLQGGNFSLTAQKGKVVVVNFWATWCGPCKLEMPQLEKDVWERNKANPDFAMIAISREEPKDTVATFAGKHPEFTFPLALDSQRSTYKLFADAGIPRTYVVDRRGVVVFESMGAGADDFSRMQEAVKKALAAR